jgi:hypothetical protein
MTSLGPSLISDYMMEGSDGKRVYLEENFPFSLLGVLLMSFLIFY